MFKNILKLLILTFLISCGEGVVEVKNISYEPRISVEGFLVPGSKPDKIRIFRNFRLNQNLNANDFIPDPFQTTVTIKDEQSGNVYPLELNIPDSLADFDNYYFKYTGDELVISYNQSYTLEVNTVIDNKALWTKSTTTVPSRGFFIKDINYSELKFAQLKDNGDYELFELLIERSPGVTFYAASIRALDTSFEKFITNHLIGELKKKDYEDRIEDFGYDTSWIQNTPSTPGDSIMRLFWFDFYFYSDYEIIVYAADKNYKEFLQTFNRVQEFDGNFHEAKFNFEGDGIGVFGSVIADTITVKVTE